MAIERPGTEHFEVEMPQKNLAVGAPEVPQAVVALVGLKVYWKTQQSVHCYCKNFVDWEWSLVFVVAVQWWVADLASSPAVLVAETETVVASYEAAEALVDYDQLVEELD